MKLIAIRHTRVAVPAGICYGQTDVPLADSYWEELSLVQAAADGVKVDAVFSSPLSRCQTLAKAVFAHHPIVLDDRLKEMNFGQWELQSWDAIYATPEGRHWMNHYQELPTAGGESLPELHQRVADFVDELSRSTHKRVAVVTHAGVIRLLKSMLENQSVEAVFSNFAPSYGGVYEFEIK